MAGRGKYVDLTDITKFAFPNVLSLQAAPTAARLLERTVGGGFMSYGQIYPRLQIAVSGYATDAFIETEFRAYKAEWKNKAIREAFRLLRDVFGGRGNWYRMPNVRTYVLGFWFKASIKGFWSVDGKVYAVLINARKGQPLSQDDVRFLARGVYELDCRDNPNNPIPMIIDLGLHEEDSERKARVYQLAPDETISLEAFEGATREFLIALNMAGIALPPPPAAVSVLDLFKRS